MDNNTVTISMKRYESLCAAEVALAILEDNRYSPMRDAVLTAVLDTMKKREEAAC